MENPIIGESDNCKNIDLISHYFIQFQGCSKIGLVPALINSNLTGNPLVHSLRAASAKMLIYGSEYQEGKFIVKALINEIYLPPISNFSFF